MARFVIAAQWQGSPSSRAMQLVDGAEAIAGDLPTAASVRIDVPLEAGDAQGTEIDRLSALVQVRDRIVEAIADGQGPAIVVGGDCGVALGALTALGPLDDIAIVWLDAHADLNTPDGSPSGAFAGMVLRAIAGEGAESLRLDPGIPPSHIVLGGVRALDLDEELYLAGNGLGILSPADLASPTALADAVAATGATRVYVHVDVDVLDPAEFAGNAHPEPFGVTVLDLVAAIRALKERMPLAGASLAGFSPASREAADDDLGAVLRIIGALA